MGITFISLVMNLRRQEDKIVIIRETKSGNYVVPAELPNKRGEESQKQANGDSFIDAESLQKVNFIKRYLALIYNFDSTSIEEQLALATDLMSTDFYEKSVRDLIELKKNVNASTESRTQSFEVLSITKVSPLIFDVEGRISTVREGKNYSFDYQIEIKIGEAEKSRTNPWGWEVASVKETRK